LAGTFSVSLSVDAGSGVREAVSAAEADGSCSAAPEKDCKAPSAEMFTPVGRKRMLTTRLKVLFECAALCSNSLFHLRCVCTHWNQSYLTTPNDIGGSSGRSAWLRRMTACHNRGCSAGARKDLCTARQATTSSSSKNVNVSKTHSAGSFTRHAEGTGDGWVVVEPDGRVVSHP